jgi:hypothetical protein
VESTEVSHGLSHGVTHLLKVVNLQVITTQKRWFALGLLLFFFLFLFVHKDSCTFPLNPLNVNCRHSKNSLLTSLAACPKHRFLSYMLLQY